MNKFERALVGITLCLLCCYIVVFVSPYLFPNGSVSAQTVTLESRVKSLETTQAALLKRVGVLETAIAVKPATNTATPAAILAKTPIPAAASGASPYVSFNQLPNLEVGTEGAISIVKVGIFRIRSKSTSVPVIVRNNTTETVKRIKISATASDKNGKMLASGGSVSVFTPNVVDPGQLSLGYVFFSDVELPEGTSIKYEITSKDLGKLENIRDLPVKEHNLIDNRIVGLLVNSYDVIVSSPMGVDVYCFDDKSNLIDRFDGYSQKDTANPGDTVPFQVNIKQPCVYYLIAARGFVKMRY